MFGDVVQRGGGRRGSRRGFGGQTAILGVPFRTGTAHIVQVGTVRTAALAGDPPQRADGSREITPHDTLPSFLPNKPARGRGLDIYLCFSNVCLKRLSVR